ncbi:melatonin receptor type 1B [Arvicanthis niloticus]|uniref:melatonin receptor type 1B n=1 Tax=Arvicanthis niloticus TaxID=61156 RepID=UPI001486136C|nr:melatonin receptor type 1B [Arvicanthis niloticus]
MPENSSVANCCEASGLAARPSWSGSAVAGPTGTPRAPWVAPMLSTVVVVTTAVDFVGNLLVILSVLRNRKLRNAGNLFVVSLALADLVVALYPYPLILVAIIHDGWALGEAHCKASAFVMGLSVIGSVFNITAIAINRYWCICHSATYHRVCSHWHAPVYISLVWLLTLVALVPNFFVGSLEYDPRIYSCTFIQTASTQYTAAVVAIHFLLPIAVVSFCYLRIWILVLQARRKAKAERKLRLRRGDLRSFLTMFVVFVVFAVCWAPLNCIGLAVAINPEAMALQVPEGLFVTSYFLAYFNSCLNAVVYGLLNQNFRREYKRIFSALWNTGRCFHEASKRCLTEELQGPTPPAAEATMPVQEGAL